MDIELRHSRPYTGIFYHIPLGGVVVKAYEVVQLTLSFYRHASIACCFQVQVRLAIIVTPTTHALHPRQTNISHTRWIPTTYTVDLPERVTQ